MGGARIQTQVPRCPAHRLACVGHPPLDPVFGRGVAAVVVFCELGGDLALEAGDLWVIPSSEEAILVGLISGPSFSVGFNLLCIAHVILL